MAGCPDVGQSQFMSGRYTDSATLPAPEISHSCVTAPPVHSWVAMSDPAWSRPSLPRRRWLLRRIAWVLAIAVPISYAMWLLARPRTVLVSLPTPITVTVPAPVVNVASPAAPAPPPAPEREPAPVVAPHALTPKLDAECVVPSEGAVAPSEGADEAQVDPACAWDFGFPAVSADGKRVAVRRVHVRPGSGFLA